MNNKKGRNLNANDQIQDTIETLCLFDKKKYDVFLFKHTTKQNKIKVSTVFCSASKARFIYSFQITSNMVRVGLQLQEIIY